MSLHVVGPLLNKAFGTLLPLARYLVCFRVFFMLLPKVAVQVLLGSYFVPTFGANVRFVVNLLDVLPQLVLAVTNLWTEFASI